MTADQKELLKAAEKVVKANAKTKSEAKAKEPEQPVTAGASAPAENPVSDAANLLDGISDGITDETNDEQNDEGGDGSSNDLNFSDLSPAEYQPEAQVEEYEGPEIYVCLSDFLFQVNGSLTSFKDKQLVNDQAMINELKKAKMPVVPAYDYAFYTQCPNCKHHFPARRNPRF